MKYDKTQLAFWPWIIWTFGGCTTTAVTPEPLPNPPAYTHVIHPIGMDLEDVRALFADVSAPSDKSFWKTCDGDFRKLESSTQSRTEILEGLRELVKLSPVDYHWCFYGKILGLEEGVKAEVFIDARQKLIVENFTFLAPLARVFMNEFHDSRYLRTAISRYRTLSHKFFNRTVDVTPAGTSELVKASNPFGLWQDTLEKLTVLDKYHISPTSTALPAPSPPPPTAAITPIPPPPPTDAPPAPTDVPLATPPVTSPSPMLEQVPPASPSPSVETVDSVSSEPELAPPPPPPS